MKVIILVVGLMVAAISAQQFAEPIFPEQVQEQFIGRIVNGQPAVNGQYPWQASIYATRGASNFVCGGSLISSLWILTAGHCVVSVSSFAIGLGSVSRTSPQVSLTATQYVLHPDYSAPTLNNDVALIRLPTAVQTSSTIQIIRLPAQSQASVSFENYIGTVSGFGRTVDDGSASDHLRYTTVRIISNAVCQQTYGSGVVIASTVCAVGDPQTIQSTCSGDSGGPLVINEGGTWTQVGIVSFVSNAGCALSYPSGYVRTASFLSWINSIADVAVRP